MRTLITFVSALTLALGTWFVPAPVAAQECSNGLCGTPNQSGGGGGGCGCGCGSILIAMTDRGDTYQFADDFDGDGIEDDFDNCPFAFNFEQVDTDADTVGDACDLCPTISDPLQANLDGDADGDVCDSDIDNDLILNDADNCPLVPNRMQTNTDEAADGGDACDDDDDNDGLPDLSDPCRLDPIATCTPSSCQCEDDPDGDGIDTNIDNCPTISNPELIDGRQLDMDGDGIGDLCDSDLDGDNIPNFRDNCVSDPNPSQLDADRDGLGDSGNWGAGAVESCDPSECYEIAADMDCLNPNASFDIQAALVLSRLEQTQIKVGDDIVIALFSNRLHVTHNWSAKFNDLPRGSRITLVNAEGSGTTLDGFPQVANCLRQDSNGGCAELNQVKFTPDTSGTYEIQITITLPNGDPAGLGADTAIVTIIAEVGDDGSAGGCAAGSTPLLAGLALGLLAVVRRRRK